MFGKWLASAWQILPNFEKLVLDCIDVSGSESRRIFPDCHKSPLSRKFAYRNLGSERCRQPSQLVWQPLQSAGRAALQASRPACNPAHSPPARRAVSSAAIEPRSRLASLTVRQTCRGSFSAVSRPPMARVESFGSHFLRNSGSKTR